MTVDEGGILRLESSGVTVRLTIADVFGQMSHADISRLIVALTDAQIIRAAIERLKNGYCDCPNDDDEDVIGRADLAEWLGETLGYDNRALIRQRDRAWRAEAEVRRDAYNARHGANLAYDAAWAAVWALRSEPGLTDDESIRRRKVSDDAYYAAMKIRNGALELCQ